MKTKYLYALLKGIRLGRAGLLAVAVTLSAIVAASAMRLDLTPMQSQSESLSQTQAVPAIAVDSLITVNSTADTVNTTDGLCTLREAIRAANNNTSSGAVPGECGAGSSTVTDTINFNVTGIIRLTSTLPTINSVMTIDGTGQSVTISGESKARVFSVPAAGTLELKGLTIANGVGGQDGINPPPVDIYGGGAILNRGGIVTITNAKFENNQAPGNTYGDGGAIANWASSSGKQGMIEIHNSTFQADTANQANHADRRGGAIFTAGKLDAAGNCIFISGVEQRSTVTIEYSTFEKSSSVSRGGAIYVDHCGTLKVSSTTFDSNQATAAGGGAIDNLGNVTVVNSTFFHNHAAANGGGIRNGSGGNLKVTNSTFSNNDANHGGGIANLVQPTKVTLYNTIVANSPRGGNCQGTITNGGGNLSWPDTTCPGINKDPRLGPLQDNGGPTKTMALLVQPVPPSPSAAIDMGLPPGADCTDHTFLPQTPPLTYDQRGFPRRVDGDHNGIPTCDIGAYEFGPALTTNAVTGVTVGEKIHDTATIKDLVDPAGTGTITFTLYSDAACTIQVFTYTTPGIPGDGSYPSGDYTTTAAGSYYWIASYSGDGNNNPTATHCGDRGETSVVNVPPTATLVLQKQVTKDNGGTAVPTDWALTATGPGPLQVIACSGQGEASCQVSAGTYTLSESGPSGYAASAWSCEKNGGAPVSGNSITLDVGDSATCTITNDDQTAHLKLHKEVTNDNGGAAKCSDFTLSAAGPTPISGQCEVESDVNAGTYNLSETGPAGYNASDWVCEGGSQIDGDTVELGLGDAATCTITNDDQPTKVTLHVVKVVTNDNGGTRSCADFSFSVNGGAAIPFESDCQNDLTVDAGTYNITEPAVLGYITTYDNCSNVVIQSGGEATCTITNNDQQAFITVVKKVTNDDGGSAAPDDFKLTLDGKPVQSGVRVPVDPGTHTAGETLLAGYTFEGFDGDCDANGNVTVALGDDRTCTLTNNDIPMPPIKVTGGGEIPVPDPTSKKQATFGFNADQTEAGSTAATGHFNYVNHDTGLHINGSVNEIQVIATNPDGSPKTVQFSGTCDGSGPACTFVVTVEDHGEPGTSDEFGITVSGDVSESQSQRVISKGNIQFHIR
jgi:CSLREA domain-containing protein